MYVKLKKTIAKDRARVINTDNKMITLAHIGFSLLKATAHCADTFKRCGDSRVQGPEIIWKLSEMTFRKKERMIDEVSIL